MDVREVRKLLDSESTRARRVRAFTALLARESGLGEDGLVLVGGSALEIYTEGEYVSEDIDLVAARSPPVESTLVHWGFRKEGVYWRGTLVPFVVQIVGSELSGSRAHTTVLATEHGRIRLAAVEDIIVKRLIAARYWKRPSALAEAMLAAGRNLAAIDWTYVDFVAARDRVSDLASRLRLAAERGDPSLLVERSERR